MQFIFCAIGLLACHQDLTRQPTKTDYTYLSVSRGGGITGLVTGCDLQPQGQIRRWKKSASGRVDSLQSFPVSLQSIEQQVKQLKSFAPLQDRGNITYRAELLLGDSTYVWTWTADQELTAWYVDTRNLCRATVADSTDQRME